MPHRSVLLTGAVPSTVVFGGYHVHSNRSDGSGSVDEIAAAAARAGLRFVVITDHGDATRPPDPPAYRDGVLCIDAVEINTWSGHLVAFGLTRASPYPLAGSAASVVEDVHRLGGRAFLAHPDSPKPDLRWQAWDVPYDGIEWLNVDSEWRDESRWRLAGALVRYLVRPPEVIASLFQRPDTTLARWDQITANRSVVALGALDSHAGPARDSGDTGGRTWLRWPSYTEMFRTIAQGVELLRPLSGDAPADAAAVVTALLAGHTFSITRAIAWPATLEFTAATSAATTTMGERVSGEIPAVTLRARVPQAADATVSLRLDGTVVASGAGGVMYESRATGGAYRVEVLYPTSSLPWIVSNPIYIGPSSAPLPPVAALRSGPDVRAMADATAWHVEKDARSTGSVAAVAGAAGGIDWRYQLADGSPAGQYVAIAADVNDTDLYDAVQFSAHADRPTRVSVQVRVPGGSRWRRSVYLDETRATFVLPLSSFDVVVDSGTERPRASRVTGVLFVVDTVNSPTGSSGRVTLSQPSLVKAKNSDKQSK